MTDHEFTISIDLFCEASGLKDTSETRSVISTPVEISYTHVPTEHWGKYVFCKEGIEDIAVDAFELTGGIKEKVEAWILGQNENLDQLCWNDLLVTRQKEEDMEAEVADMERQDALYSMYTD